MVAADVVELDAVVVEVVLAENVIKLSYSSQIKLERLCVAIFSGC